MYLFYKTLFKLICIVSVLDIDFSLIFTIFCYLRRLLFFFLFFFGAPPPPHRVLGHCVRPGRYFFIFRRGGPCPPGAYNLAGETQQMHTYTIITISDYHNIDHNCMRPGGFKISEGLGAWRRCFYKDGIRFLVQ